MEIPMITGTEEKLADILQQADGENIESVKKSNIQFLVNIKPLDLARAEQELFNRGVPLETLQNNIIDHIKLLVEPVEKTIDRLPQMHIVKNC